MTEIMTEQPKQATIDPNMIILAELSQRLVTAKNNQEDLRQKGITEIPDGITSPTDEARFLVTRIANLLVNNEDLVEVFKASGK